jgi:hypothetical protein
VGLGMVDLESVENEREAIKRTQERLTCLGWTMTALVLLLSVVYASKNWEKVSAQIDSHRLRWT